MPKISRNDLRGRMWQRARRRGQDRRAHPFVVVEKPKGPGKRERERAAQRMARAAWSARLAQT